MNRVTFTICCVLLLSSQAVGFAPIGPASSNLEKGQFALGFDYAHSEFDLEGKGGSSLLLPEFGLQWNMRSELEEIEMNVCLGRISYGIAEGSELFARLGIAKSVFAWGLGAKMMLAKSPKLDWGVGVQANWLRFEETESLPGETFMDDDIIVVFDPFNAKSEFDVTSIQIFAGPVFKFDKLRFYGGPFLSWLKVDVDCKATRNVTGIVPGVMWADVPVSLAYSYDSENDFEFGGYIGMSVGLLDNLDVQVEYQLARDLSIFGAGLSFKF